MQYKNTKLNLKMAGAFTHWDSIRVLMQTRIRPLLKEGWTLTVYDGINCRWSSGRIKRMIELDSEKVEYYNKNGVSVALTFGNPVINPLDFVGFRALNILQESSKKYGIKNNIILINHEFCEFLKINFPDLTRTYSITGHPNNIKIDDDMIQYYKDLEKDYDIIVPKFEMIFDERFLNEVDVSKYEPIIDDTCVHGCPIFREHLFEMARINREYDNPWEELGKEECIKAEECWIPTFDPDYGSDKDKAKYGCKGLGMDIYQEQDLKDFLDAGYRNIKLTGRELPDEIFVQNMNRNLDNILKVVK